MTAIWKHQVTGVLALGKLYCGIILVDGYLNTLSTEWDFWYEMADWNFYELYSMGLIVA